MEHSPSRRVMTIRYKLEELNLINLCCRVAHILEAQSMVLLKSRSTSQEKMTVTWHKCQKADLPVKWTKISIRHRVNWDWQIWMSFQTWISQIILMRDLGHLTKDNSIIAILENIMTLKKLVATMWSKKKERKRS